MLVFSTRTKERTMPTTNQPAGATGVPQASGQTDPHEIGWQEVKDLGLDPAPAGLTEDSETQQG